MADDKTPVLCIDGETLALAPGALAVVVEMHAVLAAIAGASDAAIAELATTGEVLHPETLALIERIRAVAARVEVVPDVEDGEVRS